MLGIDFRLKQKNELGYLREGGSNGSQEIDLSWL